MGGEGFPANGTVTIVDLKGTLKDIETKMEQTLNSTDFQEYIVLKEEDEDITFKYNSTKARKLIKLLSDKEMTSRLAYSDEEELLDYIYLLVLSVGIYEIETKDEDNYDVITLQSILKHRK